MLTIYTTQTYTKKSTCMAEACLSVKGTVSVYIGLTLVKMAIGPSIISILVTVSVFRPYASQYSVKLLM